MDSSPSYYAVEKFGRFVSAGTGAELPVSAAWPGRGSRMRHVKTSRCLMVNDCGGEHISQRDRIKELESELAEVKKERDEMLDIRDKCCTEIEELKEERDEFKELLRRDIELKSQYFNELSQLRANSSIRTCPDCGEQMVRGDGAKLFDECNQLRARLALMEKVRIAALNLLKGTPTRIDGTFCPHNQPQNWDLYEALKAIDAAEQRKCGLCTDIKPCNWAGCPDDINSAEDGG